MTRQIYRTILGAALVVLAAGAIGCRSICKHPGANFCEANRQAGLATISCQPLDVEATSANQPVEFTVEACGRGLTYQWFFNDEPISSEREGAKDYQGANEWKLKVLKVNERTIGFYRCEIDSVDSFGIPLRTSTRSATLGTTYSIRMPNAIIAPTQRLPKPGSPANCPCGGKFCASLSFRNGTTGYIPPAGNPPPANCVLTVATNAVTVPKTAYEILVYDGAKQFCAGDGADDTKVFAITPGAHNYRFTVYFKCPSPGNLPLVGLTIDWQ